MKLEASWVLLVFRSPVACYSAGVISAPAGQHAVGGRATGLPRLDGADKRQPGHRQLQEQRQGQQRRQRQGRLGSGLRQRGRDEAEGQSKLTHVLCNGGGSGGGERNFFRGLLSFA